MNIKLMVCYTALALIIGVKAFFIFPSLAVAEDKPNVKNLTSQKQAEEVRNDVNEFDSGTSAAHQHSLGLGLGQTFLKGDFEDNGDDAINIDIIYNYSASHSFDLMLDLHHSEHKLGAKKTTLNGFAPFIKAKVFQFDAFSPFFGGGIGFYSPKVKRELNGSIKESKSKTVLGYNLGAGCELRLNRNMLVGVIGQLHNPFDVKQETDPAVEGSYYKLLIFALYTF
ncbi:MAG: outer membrane beta-barrel protein [Bdellovibrio sp.]|nr:outer membrane beta-barrel protein [Bdellovibrio sp.]